MLSRLKISQKIYLLGTIQLILMLVMGIVALSQMNRIGLELVDIAEDNIPLNNKLSSLSELQIKEDKVFEQAVRVRSMDGTSDSNQYREYKQQALELSSNVSQQGKDIKQFISIALPKLHDENSRQIYQNINTKLNEFLNGHQQLKELTLEIFSQAKLKGLAGIEVDIRQRNILANRLEESILSQKEKIQQLTENSANKAENDEKYAIQLIGGLFAIAVVIGLLLPVIISRAISTPVNTLQSRLTEVAEGDGDLTLILDDSSRDETGAVATAFNHFLKVLRNMIMTIHGQAETLGKSSSAALSVMQQTLTNVEKQRIETDMVATAVEELSTTSLDVARSAANASQVTDGVRQRVMQGKQGALDTQDIIQKLATEVSEASKVIRNLVEETNNIGSVLAAIQGIAEQTNLLALNAAIEAARAGESGRGFAVVADEVRSLAQRTQTSTVDIQHLVERLQTEAQNAVNSMQKGSDSADLCLEKSVNTTAIFEEASDAVNEITDLNIQIATAAEQQSCVAEEINQNLVNISQIAEVTTQSAREAAGENENIANVLSALRGDIGKFRTV